MSSSSENIDSVGDLTIPSLLSAAGSKEVMSQQFFEVEIKHIQLTLTSSLHGQPPALSDTGSSVTCTCGRYFPD